MCFSQLLTPSVLIARLINAHRHLLALRISEYLGMNQVGSNVLISQYVNVILGLCPILNFHNFACPITKVMKN